jgi:hypothetical protein
LKREKMGNCYPAVGEPVYGVHGIQTPKQHKTEMIPFKTTWEDSPTEMYGYCGVINRIAFESGYDKIGYGATMGHLTRPCTHVHIVPTSFEKYGNVSTTHV